MITTLLAHSMTADSESCVQVYKSHFKQFDNLVDHLNLNSIIKF